MWQRPTAISPAARPAHYHRAKMGMAMAAGRKGLRPSRPDRATAGESGVDSTGEAEGEFSCGSQKRHI